MSRYSGKGYWNKSQPLKITNKKDSHICTQGNKTQLKAAMPRDCCFRRISSNALNDDDDDDDDDDNNDDNVDDNDDIKDDALSVVDKDDKN